VKAVGPFFVCALPLPSGYRNRDGLPICQAAGHAADESGFSMRRTFTDALTDHSGSPLNVVWHIRSVAHTQAGRLE
jgi:hypothetical protein